jgi:AGCS family alanine or glycine:cation symporter
MSNCSWFRAWVQFSLLFAVITTISLQNQASASHPATPRIQETSVEQADDSEDGDIPPTQEEAAAEEPDWMDTVDGWFGDYLVTPMSTVLFFDFFTGPEANNPNDHPFTSFVNSAREKMGVPQEGWLKTSVPFVVVWLLLGGIYFTIKMGFINIRAFWHAIKLVRGSYDDPNDVGDVSHFQALSAALSATVGLGNIAGVALAIAAGGPGATLWMIVIGLIGMSSKFTECSLGQMYRKTDAAGQISGGPMHYLKDGLTEMGMRPLGLFLAFLFSILCIGGSIGGGNTFQVVQSLGAISADENMGFLRTYPWIYGIVMVVLVGLVIIGGIKSIGRWASRIVPLMCGIYVLFALFIIVKNGSMIPDAFGKIFTEAFTPDAVYGGFLGVLVIGITRAVFSNEAGTGSAAIAHSAAKTDIPVREGIVALLEPFIDTVIVCSMTALVLIITGAYAAPETEAIRAAGNGAALTSYAFQNGGFVWFKYVLYVAMFLFAFSTCISWSYYGERCFTQWFGQRSSIVYKILFLVFTFLGSIVSAENIRSFSDILILSMALPNILGVLLLSGKVKAELNDYWGKVRSGEIKPHKV